MISVRQYLVREIALTLGRRPEDINTNVPFSRMGIKSSDLVTIRSRLAMEIRQDLPAAAGEDYPTISAVASFWEKVLDEIGNNDGSGCRSPEQTPLPESHLLALSAKDKTELHTLSSNYIAFLDRHPETNPKDFCYTVNAGQTDGTWRAAVSGKDNLELAKELAHLKTNDLSLGGSQGVSSMNPAFLFTGQGSQYPGMGRDLYCQQPVFREEMDRCIAILSDSHAISLKQLLFEQNDSQLLDQTANTQPALFSLEYAMAQMYRSWGIEPAFVMGHSVGEFVAACVAGVFSLEDGLKLISARGRLIQTLPQEGKMVACLCAGKLVEDAITPYGNDISVAAANGPANTVISGKNAAVKEVCKRFEADGISWIPLQTSHAFHSILMEPMIEAFRDVAETVRYGSPQIPYISNITGDLVENDEVCFPDYWCRHIRSPVMFESGIHALYRAGCRLFQEIGPSPVLSGMGAAILSQDGAEFVPSLRRGWGEEKAICTGLSMLYMQGADIDWDAFFKPFSPAVISIPQK
ncbi:MAG: acyltransferase domain-containing protein [Desulfobacterales bacterium]|nr:acyltransferase domain-containing protein [Desulfobacterales bacterium]